jgi:hypothetical protein
LCFEPNIFSSKNFYAMLHPNTLDSKTKNFHPNLFIFNHLHLFLLLFLYFTPPPQCGAQEACLAMPCDPDKFTIEIFPLNNTVWDCNNPSGFASNPSCGGGGDPYHQIFYQVRLRYVDYSGDLFDAGFYLNYAQLTINTKLHIFPNSGSSFSYIDSAATMSCWKNIKAANNWIGVVTEKFQESTNGNQFVIDFTNSIINDPCATGTPTATSGNPIHFTHLIGPDPVYGAPPCPTSNFNLNINCLYANLFVVAVNAYPGESFRVECDVNGVQPTTYKPIPGTTTPCTPTCVAQTLQPPVAAYNSPGAGNVNAGIQLKLLPPSNPHDVNGCQIPLVITNQGNTTVIIDHAEFVVKVSRSVALPEAITGVLQAYYNATVSNTDTYYYFNFPLGAITALQPGATITLATYIVNPPIPNNLSWSTTVALINPQKTRLMTTTADNQYCSTLPYMQNFDSQTCSYAGISPCSISDIPVEFHIEPVSPVTGTTLLRIGLKSKSSTLTSIDLNKFAFEVDFTADNGMSISSIGNTAVFCTNGNTGSYCLDFFGNNNTASCTYTTISPLTFKFCMGDFSTPQTIYFDANQEAYMDVNFSGLGCIKKAEVKRLILQKSGSDPCIPTIANNFDPTKPICVSSFFGSIATEVGELLDPVEITLDAQSCPPPPDCSGNVTMHYYTSPQQPGIYDFTPCPKCQGYIITPKNDDNPLNGVSTYDLVLISKHILGIQPLGSPYKMIAADANKNGSITTFDIVEIRKLILGINTTYLNNTSWRFVPKSYVFPNPNNPFSATFPEKWTYPGNPISNPIDFVAIKVGDVNGSATPNAKPHNPTFVSFAPSPASSPDQYVTIPVTYTGNDPLQAIQLGIRFDPTRYTVIGPSQGNIPAYNAGNFGMTRLSEGEIRTLWLPDALDPFHRIKKGDVLFYLTVKNLSPESTATDILSLDDQILENLAWNDTGVEFAIKSDPVATDRTEDGAAPAPVRATCRPNPTNGAVSIALHSDQAGSGRLAIYGPFGIRHMAKDVDIRKGDQEFELPEVAQLPAGIYIWKVYAFDATLQGRLVKQ